MYAHETALVNGGPRPEEARHGQRVQPVTSEPLRCGQIKSIERPLVIKVSMTMKKSLKKFRPELDRSLYRTRKRLTQGWRELLVRSSRALTEFARSSKSTEAGGVPEDSPQWALLAAESWETAKSIIVRIEIPGMRKEDLEVSITQHGLRVRGEKHPPGDAVPKIYSLMERAFGRFERTIALPNNIDASQAEVVYQDGVITVIVPKTKAVPSTQLSIQ